jgi:hypothetical protein
MSFHVVDELTPFKTTNLKLAETKPGTSARHNGQKSKLLQVCLCTHLFANVSFAYKLSVA